jgi:hypothetical protein
MDMRAKITKEKFAALKGNDLGWELIHDVVLPLRGKSLEKKQAVYEQLTPGQKALFAFWVVCGHTQSGWSDFHEAGYFSHLPMLRKGLEHIQAQALSDNLETAQKLYLGREDGLKPMPREAQEPPPKGKPESAELDEALPPALNDASQRMEAYIRGHAEEFVEFCE